MKTITRKKLIKELHKYYVERIIKDGEDILDYKGIILNGYIGLKNKDNKSLLEEYNVLINEDIDDNVKLKNTNN